MRGSKRSSRWGATGRALSILLVVALGAMIVAGLSACGGDTDVAGTYVFDSGSEEGMEGFTLTLDGDETFTLGQESTEDAEGMTISGTYTVDGDQITLKAEGEDGESEVGTVEGDKLVFETITWVKQ
jgi:hypothetical protein